ncbi:MAG: nucleoside hydrolase [Clostridia bacterium]|nr:nucleoside hydrolase [Clostridia bacterium]
MKIALLCDYGFDDAIATLHLFNNADKFDGIDILPVAGNFPLETAFNNAKRLVYNAEVLPEKLRIVNTAEIEQKGENIPHIHGNDGMGDILPAEYEEKVSVISYGDWLNEVNEDYVILSLGPCTVTADLLSKKGSLPLIMMAGNINERPNYKSYEFNHGVNPDAFAKCVKHPHKAATLDTCHCDKIDLNVTSVKKDGLIGKMIARYKEMSNVRKDDFCAIYDLVAVVYLLHPERFTSEVKIDAFNNAVTVLRYISEEPII